MALGAKRCESLGAECPKLGKKSIDGPGFVRRGRSGIDVTPEIASTPRCLTFETVETAPADGTWCKEV